MSTDFAIKALRGASQWALGIAAAGVVVWVVITYLQWHQAHQNGGSNSQQALLALEPFSYLILAALLGLVGFGCRVGANWMALRLRSVYLDTSPTKDS